MSELKIVYRALLKLAMQFDHNPAAKSLIYRISTPTIKPTSHYSQLHNVFMGSANFYFKSLCVPSFYDLVIFFWVFAAYVRLFSYLFILSTLLYNEFWFLQIRSEFRTEYIGIYSVDERIHSAYLSLRKYSSIWSCYEKHRGARDETGAQHENLNKLLNLKIKSTISNDVRAGVLLISHPLAAQHYKRSVILLLKHDENGSQGIIVNHRSEQLLPSAIENLPSTLLQKNYTLNFGGTVARLNCVHNCKQLGGESIQNCTSPLFHGIDLSLITKLPYPCQNKTSKIHLFIGSCVWPPEELKNQIKIGFWLPVETHNDAFFDLIQGIDEERKSYNFHTNETALSYCTKSDREQECVNTNNTYRTGLISTLVLLLKISLLFSSHL